MSVTYPATSNIGPLAGVEPSNILAQAGLRSTGPRLALANLLFGRAARHVSVDGLYAELLHSGSPGSLSCVYNSLRRFSEIGLVRRVPIYGLKAYFDTGLHHHHHFYDVDEDRLMDVSSDTIALAATPSPPRGYDLVSIDVLVRIRRAETSPPPA